MGPDAGAHREIPRCRRPRDLHAGLRGRLALVGGPLVLGAARGTAPGHRRVARADRHCRFRPAGAAGSRCEPDQQPRSRAAVDDLRRLMAQRHRPRHGGPDRCRAEAAVRQSGRVRSRNVLSREGAIAARDGDQQPARLARLRRLAERRAAGHPAPAVHRGRQAADRRDFDRAPVGPGAHVHRDAAAERSDRVDARPVRHVVVARDPLHGRDLRLLPADCESAVEAADADAAQAGPRVRTGVRARDTEPGRSRLQGPRERGHVDDRPLADRARQAARARRTRKCRAGLGPQRAGQDDLGTDATRVPDAQCP